jgi:hypothetical protein
MGKAGIPGEGRSQQGKARVRLELEADRVCQPATSPLSLASSAQALFHPVSIQRQWHYTYYRGFSFTF